MVSNGWLDDLLEQAKKPFNGPMVMLYLARKAALADCRYKHPTAKQVYALSRGQIIISHRQAKELFGWSPGRFARFIDRKAKLGELIVSKAPYSYELKSGPTIDTGITLITVCIVSGAGQRAGASKHTSEYRNAPATDRNQAVMFKEKDKNKEEEGKVRSLSSSLSVKNGGEPVSLGSAISNTDWSRLASVVEKRQIDKN